MKQCLHLLDIGTGREGRASGSKLRSNQYNAVERTGFQQFHSLPVLLRTAGSQFLHVAQDDHLAGNLHLPEIQ